MSRRYTEEENAFLREFIPGHSEGEIADAFEERFGIRLKRCQVKNRKTALRVTSGTHGGRFKKGLVPANKGKTWDEMGISPEAQARSRATCFKKGDEPVTGRSIPIGTERVSRDGYIEVKVKRFSDRPCANKCWRMKHHLVWEEFNGRHVPPNTMIVFADGDKRNFDPENLIAVPRSIWAVISHDHIPFHDRYSLEAAVALAELKRGIHRRRCENHTCRSCGCSFRARYPNQKTCEKCLAKMRPPI